MVSIKVVMVSTKEVIVQAFGDRIFKVTKVIMQAFGNMMFKVKEVIVEAVGEQDIQGQTDGKM